MQFDWEALKALASPSVPLAAAEKAIGLAADGKHITREEANELIGQARAEETAKALAEGRERTASEGEAERRRGEKDIAKATKAAETATAPQSISTYPFWGFPPPLRRRHHISQKIFAALK